MSQNQLPYVPSTPEVDRLYQAVNQLILGNASNTGSVTLTESAASTSVSNNRVGADAVILLMPKTANAASELASGNCYVSSVTKGSFTITHQNNAQTDRDFDYIHVG